VASSDNSPQAVPINKNRFARPVSFFWKKDIELEAARASNHKTGGPS
jgi:hypothetical protein